MVKVGPKAQTLGTSFIVHSKYPEAETWDLDEWSYYKLSENLEVGPGGNLDPICLPPQKNA